MKNKVLIFGAGGVGAKVKKKLEESYGYCVIAFCDNNSARWGEEFEGCLIIPPSDIIVDEYDFFAIGVYKAQMVIKEQLTKMGVPKTKIIIPEEPNRITINKSIEFEKKEMGRRIAVSLGDGVANIYCEKVGDLIDCWDFENNFWAFRYLIDDILSISNNENYGKWWVKNDISEYVKLKISFYYIDSEFDLEMIRKCESQLIISDSILLDRLAHNRNSYYFWKDRLPRQLEKGFISRVESLKDILDEYNIPLDEVAIVSGSILQAYGLREEKFVDDIDIIMTNRFRKLYGDGLVIVSDSAEMHPKNEMKIETKNLDVSDEEIICEEKNHFYFRGLKFCTLQLLYEYRCHIGDNNEVKLMEYFGCTH